MALYTPTSQQSGCLRTDTELLRELADRLDNAVAQQLWTAKPILAARLQADTTTVQIVPSNVLAAHRSNIAAHVSRMEQIGDVAARIGRTARRLADRFEQADTVTGELIGVSAGTTKDRR